MGCTSSGVEMASRRGLTPSQIRTESNIVTSEIKDNFLNFFERALDKKLKDSGNPAGILGESMIPRATALKHRRELYDESYQKRSESEHQRMKSEVESTLFPLVTDGLPNAIKPIAMKQALEIANSAIEEAHQEMISAMLDLPVIERRTKDALFPIIKEKARWHVDELFFAYVRDELALIKHTSLDELSALDRKFFLKDASRRISTSTAESLVFKEVEKFALEEVEKMREKAGGKLNPKVEKLFYDHVRAEITLAVRKRIKSILAKDAEDVEAEENQRKEEDRRYRENAIIDSPG